MSPYYQVVWIVELYSTLIISGVHSQCVCFHVTEFHLQHRNKYWSPACYNRIWDTVRRSQDSASNRYPSWWRTGSWDAENTTTDVCWAPVCAGSGKREKFNYQTLYLSNIAWLVHYCRELSRWHQIGILGWS